ncbi:hypothetical protein P7C73_g5049, partial [Tremellales sp. Uapishka_1]
MSELSAWRQVTAIGPPQPHLASSPVSQPCLEDTSVAADIAYGIRSSDLSSTGHRVPVGGSDSLPHEELEIREQSVIDFNYAAVQDEVERKVRRRVGFPARLGRGTVPPELPVDEDEDLIFTKDQEKFTSWHCKYLAEKSLDITERGAGGNANVYAEIVTSQSWAAMSAALKMGGQSLLGLSIKDMPMARRIVVPVMTADGVEHTRPVKTGELEDVLMGFAEVMDEEPFDHLPVPLLPTSTLLSDRIDLWKKGQSAHFKIVPGAPRSNRAVEPDVAGKSQGSLDLGFGVIAIDGVAVGLKGGYRQLRQVYGEPETRERDDVTFTLVTLMDNVALALHIVQGTEIHLEPASFHALRRLFDLLFRLLVVNMCTDIPIYTHFGMYTLGIVYLRKLGASAATNHALEYEAGQTVRGPSGVRADQCRSGDYCLARPFRQSWLTRMIAIKSRRTDVALTSGFSEAGQV